MVGQVCARGRDSLEFGRPGVGARGRDFLEFGRPGVGPGVGVS